MWRPTANLKLLALVLAWPCSGYALGLGDIHVESALGQPLDAYIEIRGVSGDDMAKIRGSIADQALFQRYGLEHPQFLSSTTITVRQDKAKGPILLIRSTQAAAEPIVSLLVNVHSPAGEVAREYTVLLDPPGLTPEAASVPSSTTPTSVEPYIVSKGSRPVVSPVVEPVERIHTIAQHETLQRIVARTGARSKLDQHRMMVAIYRDNPGAFAKNMNAMRRGAVLRLPHAAELAAISAEDADREYSAQMTAWKGPKHSNPPRIRAAVADATNASVRENAEAEAAAESTIALTRRIQALEESLRRGREELNKPLPVPAAQPSETEVKVPSLDEEAPAPMWKFGIPWEAVVGGCLLVLALGVGLLLRGRRPSKSPEPFPFSEEHDDLAVDDLKALALQRAGFDNDQSLPNAKVSTARTDVDGGEKPVAPVSVSKPVSAAPKTGRSGDTTVVLAVTDSKYDETVELTLSGFNPEETINTMHVTMPDSLQDEKPSVERRKNPAEVLRQALEREPMRSDLRLKLLELYYIAAAQNRQAFLEIAHQLADNINLVSPREWLQIVEMGRKIASDDPLFAEERDDQAVA